MFHTEQPVIVKDEFASYRKKALLHHEVRITQDDDPIIFHWHFQKGILDKRMSGWELATFILPEMQSILDAGFLALNQEIENEFRAFLHRLTHFPVESLDEVLPWLQVTYHEQEDDLITMNMSELAIHSKRTSYSY